jgi:RNA polymerase sigma-70 factor (ECF subfamily)
MGDREVDQQLGRASATGDKRAFELLVTKIPAQAGQAAVAAVRDPAEVEDVTQEAFIKAYRRCRASGEKARSTRGSTASASTRRRTTSSRWAARATVHGFDHEEAENFEDAEQLRDTATPETS